jgi:hypothetical protein
LYGLSFGIVGMKTAEETLPAPTDLPIDKLQYVLGKRTGASISIGEERSRVESMEIATFLIILDLRFLGVESRSIRC